MTSFSIPEADYNSTPLWQGQNSSFRRVAKPSPNSGHPYEGNNRSLIRTWPDDHPNSEEIRADRAADRWVSVLVVVALLLMLVHYLT